MSIRIFNDFFIHRKERKVLVNGQISDFEFKVYTALPQPADKATVSETARVSLELPHPL